MQFYLQCRKDKHALSFNASTLKISADVRSDGTTGKSTPTKKIIQISHTCRAGVSEANPRQDQCVPRMLQTAGQSDQPNDRARTGSADLKLRILN